MQVEGTRMYRVKDVAEHFHVSVNTMYRAIELGQLDALKHGAGRGTLRIPGTAVLAYAETRRQAAYDSVGTGGAPSAALSPAAADGLACVVCGVDYREVPFTPRRPVGVSHTDSPVFACDGHRGVRLTATGGYVDVIACVPEPAATVHIDACRRSLAHGRGRGVGAGAGEVAR